MRFRSSRENYGDSAVSYVNLKRENNVCIVKGSVCPEHKNRNKPYRVTIIVDEEKENVQHALCEDCAASAGI